MEEPRDSSGRESRTEEVLQECGALLKGHFRYTSGRHGDTYFEKIAIVQQPSHVDLLGGMMAEMVEETGIAFDMVCAPAFGAIVFGYAAALHMRLPFAFLQRDSKGQMKLRKGFELPGKGTRVLLVEDVTTTGGSIRESIEVINGRGASVEMVGLIVDRTGGRLELEVPYGALLTVDVPSWEPEDCPLCVRGLPLDIPGSSGKARR